MPENFTPAPGTPRPPPITPILVRCAAYKTFIHHADRLGQREWKPSDIRTSPVLMMMFRTQHTWARALLEMAALGMVERLAGRGRGLHYRTISDQPKLVCCVCGEPLTGNCVQDSECRLAHAACAEGAMEEHQEPVTDRRA